MRQVSQISSGQSLLSIQELMAARREEAVSGSSAVPPAVETAPNSAIQPGNPTSGADVSLMSGNFAGERRQQSRYVQARLDTSGKNALLEQAQKQKTFALVREATALYDHGPRAHRSEYVELYKQSLKIRNMMRGKLREAQQEAGEEAMTRIKDERESKIKELIAPKDGNGEAIQAGTDAANSTALPSVDTSHVYGADTYSGIDQAQADKDLSGTATLPEYDLEGASFDGLAGTGESIDIKV